MGAMRHIVSLAKDVDRWQIMLLRALFVFRAILAVCFSVSSSPLVYTPAGRWASLFVLSVSRLTAPHIHIMVGN